MLQACYSFLHFTEGGSEGETGRGESPQVHSSLVAGVGQLPEIPE